MITIITSAKDYYKNFFYYKNQINSQSKKINELIIVIDDEHYLKYEENINKISNVNKLKIINNKKNIGIALSLNKALKLATSKYILRLDVDDYITENLYKYSYDLVKKNSKIDIFLNLNNRYIFNYFFKDNEMLFNNPFVHSGFMFKNKLNFKYIVKKNKNYPEDLVSISKIIFKKKKKIYRNSEIIYKKNNKGHSSINKNNSFYINTTINQFKSNFKNYLIMNNYERLNFFQKIKFIFKKIKFLRFIIIKIKNYG